MRINRHFMLLPSLIKMISLSISSYTSFLFPLDLERMKNNKPPKTCHPATNKLYMPARNNYKGYYSLVYFTA